jgi:chromosomal replication initiator protein
MIKKQIFDIKKSWEAAKKNIAGSIGDSETYSRWIDGIAPLSFKKGIFLLGVSDDFTAEWIKAHFEDIIRKSLSGLIEGRFRISYEKGRGLIQERAESPPVSIAAPPANSRPADDDTDVCKGNGFTFNSYVVGPENRFAYAAAFGSVSGDGASPNPLFIYGSTSCGKTHLLKAVSCEAKKRGKVVEYVQCEDFLNIYVDSLRNRMHYAFRNRFRSVDYLLIDDIQFIATAPRLQEEFFNTFNSLQNENKKVMLTSDKRPVEINGLESRLISRFESGLTLEIEPYGEETRLAILRKKQESHNVKINDEILKLIAKNINSHVRKLEGALNRLVGAVIYTGCEMTLPMAEKILRPYLEEAALSRITIDNIQKKVAEYYDLRVSDLTGRKRPGNIVGPRMVAMFLCRQLTDKSLPEIGEAFGRNHATVIHAVKKIDKNNKTDSSLSGSISQMKRRIQSVS